MFIFGITLVAFGGIWDSTMSLALGTICCIIAMLNKDH